MDNTKLRETMLDNAASYYKELQQVQFLPISLKHRKIIENYYALRIAFLVKQITTLDCKQTT